MADLAQDGNVVVRLQNPQNKFPVLPSSRVQRGELPEILVWAAWPRVWEPGASDLKHYNICGISQL